MHTQQSNAPSDAATPSDPEARPADVPDSIDYAVSGLRHLGPGGRARALDPKANPFEKKKNAKGGDAMWTEVHELAALLKEGKSTFEDLDLDDVDVRLKWVGLFHRRKVRWRERCEAAPHTALSLSNLDHLPFLLSLFLSLPSHRSARPASL